MRKRAAWPLAGETGPALDHGRAPDARARGRRGRAWESAAGNLAATLLLQPGRRASEWPQLSFVAAIAAADMAAHFAPQARDRGQMAQ